MGATMKRRQLLRLAAAAAGLPLLHRPAWALDYPTRPVHILVGFAAGGPNDISARLMAQWLSQRLGQQFIVENRTGAGGNIATEAVVRAPADGYTLLLVPAPAAINATLYHNLSFNFIRDIAPVAGIVRVPEVMVINPGKINMASAGNGSVPHVAGELFKFMTGLDLVRVGYRGGGPALVDLLGGQ